ncbi:hypothetical protein EAX61_04975 [Dokdonia sinensis]|uniref:Uncharacterized protein n=2 Tax=Dokdonia sinensis TaxID=2479847 RepID=A0A3M0GNY2_9FLAO|nr:hypothetical protein EAX61_04975 [Dokdonia sinensis]
MQLISCIILIALSQNTIAQVGIGTTTPAEGVMLDIESTNSGILIPRVALTSKATQAPITTVGALQVGTLVFNNATAGTGSNAVSPGFYYWSGSLWTAITPAALDAWELEGNAGTTPGTGPGQNYLGTSDTQNLIIATDGSPVLTLTTGGQIQANNPGTLANPSFTWSADTDTGLFKTGADVVQLTAGGRELASFIEAGNNSEVVINDSSVRTNFRVEGNNDTNALFVESQTDDVGIGTNDPDARLEIRQNSATTESEILKLTSQSDRGLSILSPDAGDNDDPFTYSTNNAHQFRVDANDALLIASDGDIGVGTTNLQGGAQLEMGATDKGILINRVALTGTADTGTVTVNAGAAGMLVYNTASAGTGATAVSPGFYYWNGTAWIAMGGTNGNDWALEGNSGTTPGTGPGQNYLGTSDVTNLIIATSDTERMRILANGEIGINSAGNAAFRLVSVGTDGEIALGGLSSTTGSGVQGGNTGTGFGVIGFGANTGVGVQGQNSGAGNAVVGINTGTGSGGYFQSGDVNSALRSFATGTGYGLAGVNLGTGNAIYSQSTDGIGIVNIVGGSNVGLYTDLTDAGGIGEQIDLDTNDGTGVFVIAVDDATTPTAGGNAYGFFAEVRTQTATIGNTVSGAAFVGNQTGVGHGILLNHSGIAGRNAEFNIENNLNTDPTIFATHQGEGSTLQIQNQKNNAIGTLSVADISYTGIGNIDHIAVNANSTPGVGFGVGVLGTGGFYGVFSNGNFGATGTKTFLIDHPEDPSNKLLRHYSVESDEVLNIYRGTATFDSSGNATIDLPSYYDDVNRNPSYQLTAVGAAMPNMYVAREIANNSFIVSGGVAGAKVSWQITAERDDPYMQQNPELRKPELIKEGTRAGKYLTPELYNQPKEKGMFYTNGKSKKEATSKAAINPKAASISPQLLEEDKNIKIATPIQENQKER